MITKSMRTNFILALTLIILGSAAYWNEFKHKPQRQKAEEAKSKLLPVTDVSELETLQIVDKEKSINVTFACKESCKISDPNSKWFLTLPIEFPGDEANIETFITSLAGATIQETLPLNEGGTDPQVRLKEYELGPDKRDQRKVVIKLKGQNEPFVAYLGETSVVGENVYVYTTGPGVQNDVVRIVPGFVKASIDRNLSYWRTKRLFNFAASEVEGLKLMNPAGTMEFVKDSGSWVYLPRKKLADSEAIDTFVTGLVFTNAQDYAADDKVAGKKKLGLGSPKYSVTLRLAKQQSVTLELYDVLGSGKTKHDPKQNKLYAILSNRPFVAELDRTNVEKFGKKADSFRFHNLIAVGERSDTSRIDVTLEGKDKLSFERAGASWKVVSGNITDFDPASVDQALTRIGYARITDFVEPKAIPATAKEQSNWTLRDKGGKTLASFTLFSVADKAEIFARVRDGVVAGETGKLERSSGAAVPSKIVDFQKKKL